ncbi:MAG: c-type cytochrome [Saprospiraceae bacterium]|nr:c-type cytochrome [Candidatus Vicinibacter proximus]
MKYIIISYCLLLLMLLTSGGIPEPFFKVPKGWPKPNYSFTQNQLSQTKIDLGRALFYDPILSKDSTISCASCHNPYTSFAHTDHALSHGIHDSIGNRNAPALLNLAWQKSFMWDGAIHHLDMQALSPITNPIEMNEDFAHVIGKLQKKHLYPGLFYTAFGDSLITGANTLKAFSAFLLTLVSDNTKYDSVYRKQSTFTDQEKNGLKLFRKHCAQCHTEPLFSNQAFENNGLLQDSTLNDIGRMKITGLTSDSLKFKVPTLRNIEFTAPYMHDGRFKNLSEVLKHYTSGIHQSKTLSEKLKNSIALKSNEKVDLIAFLLTLSDKSFLFDPKNSFPKFIFFKK